jgi:hypothetical protein
MGLFQSKAKYKYKTDEFENDKDVLIKKPKTRQEKFIEDMCRIREETNAIDIFISGKENYDKYDNFVNQIKKIIEETSNEDDISVKIVELNGGFIYCSFYNCLVIVDCVDTLMITKKFPSNYKFYKKSIDDHIYKMLYVMYSNNLYIKQQMEKLKKMV